MEEGIESGYGHDSMSKFGDQTQGCLQSQSGIYWKKGFIPREETAGVLNSLCQTEKLSSERNSKRIAQKNSLQKDAGEI